MVHLPSAVGHFLGYAQCFVEAALQRYSSVYFLVPERERPDAFSTLCDRGAQRLTYRSGLPEFPWAGQEYFKFGSWLGVRRACKDLAGRLKQPIDLILTFIDMFPVAFAVWGTPSGVAPVFALTMRADLGQHGSRGLHAGLKHWLWHRLIRNFPGVLASNDPCLVKRLGSKTRVQLLEDFSFCHDIAPVGSPEPELCCLAIGYLDARKNLSPLMQAALICRRNGLPVRLILAGELIENELDEAGSKALTSLRAHNAVSEWPGRIPETEYRQALTSAHVVWALYREHEFASGVVIDAIAAGRALLAQTTGVIGHYSRRYRLAVTHSPDASADTIAKGLAQIRELIMRSNASGDFPMKTTGTSPLNDRSQYVDRISRALASLQLNPTQ